MIINKIKAFFGKYKFITAVVIFMFISLIARVGLFISDKVAYNKCVKNQTIEECEKYLSHHQKTSHTEEIKDLMETLYYEKIKTHEENIEEVFYKYYNLYQEEGKNYSNIMHERAEYKYNKIKSTKDLNQILNFYKFFPNNSLTIKIDSIKQQVIDSLIYLSKKIAKKPDARYQNFIIMYFNYLRNTHETEIPIYFSDNIKVKDWDDYSENVKKYLEESDEKSIIKNLEIPTNQNVKSLKEYLVYKTSYLENQIVDFFNNQCFKQIYDNNKIFVVSNQDKPVNDSALVIKIDLEIKNKEYLFFDLENDFSQIFMPEMKIIYDSTLVGNRYEYNFKYYSFEPTVKLNLSAKYLNNNTYISYPSLVSDNSKFVFMEYYYTAFGSIIYNFENDFVKKCGYKK